MKARANIELYDFPLSIYCQMVRVALAEKGVEPTKRTVNITQPAEQFQDDYLDVNPNAVVPSLVIDGTVHIEALHILRQLDAALDGPLLQPEGRADRAAMESWMARADGIDYAALLYATKLAPDGSCPPLRARLDELRAARARRPELAVTLDRRIADNVELSERLRVGDEPRAQRERVQAHLGDLDRALDGRRWLAGDRYSLADVVWTATLARCVMQGLLILDDPARSRVARYYAELKSRPSFGVAGVVERMPASFAGPPPGEPARAAGC